LFIHNFFTEFGLVKSGINVFVFGKNGCMVLVFLKNLSIGLQYCPVKEK